MSTHTSTPITDINNIPDKKDYDRDAPYETSIPDKFRNKIIGLIEEIEAETGQNYYISMRVEGKNMTEIYPLEERTRTYEVNMSDEKFVALNGIYPSLNAIKDKIAALDQENYANIVPIEFVKGNYVWKCPQCDSYGSEQKYRVKGEIVTSMKINRLPSSDYCNTPCYNCRYDPNFGRTDWIKLKLNPQHGSIGTWSAGSISLVHNLGSLKVIR